MLGRHVEPRSALCVLVRNSLTVRRVEAIGDPHILTDTASLRKLLSAFGSPAPGTYGEKLRRLSREGPPPSGPAPYCLTSFLFASAARVAETVRERFAEWSTSGFVIHGSGDFTAFGDTRL